MVFSSENAAPPFGINILRESRDRAQFVSPKWNSILKEQGLADFEALWGLDVPLLGEPNRGHGRNGWSSAALLSTSDKKLILKRQQNYCIRTFSHPLQGIPTLRNEALSTLEFSKLGIPAMELVAYAERQDPDGVKAILLTEYLSGYVSLDALHSIWRKRGWPADRRHRLIECIGRTVRVMHEKGIRHNSLYPKHIFVKKGDGDVGIRLIDLEKVRRSPIGHIGKIRDLDSLNRHAEGWSMVDRLRFIKSYCDTDQLGPKEERLFRDLLKASRRKGVRRLSARSVLQPLLRKMRLIKRWAIAPVGSGADENFKL